MFRNDLITIIKNTNEMLCEDGQYSSYCLFEISNRTYIQYVNQSEHTEIELYEIDCDVLEDPYMEAYKKDGGDSEYDNVCYWILNWNVVKEVGIKVEVLY